MPEMLDLEMSFEEIGKLPIAPYFALPINADLGKFEQKIKKLGFPLWIKLNSWEHKLELGAVKRADSIEELKKTYLELKKNFPDKKFIIQKHVKGVELIAGIKEDKTFGKILLLGSGGSFAELIKDTEFRVLPIAKEEILSALKQLKIFKILEEKSCSIDKLVELIENFSKLSIKEADLNPVIVNEKEALVIDARVSPEEE